MRQRTWILRTSRSLPSASFCAMAGSRGPSRGSFMAASAPAAPSPPASTFLSTTPPRPSSAPWRGGGQADARTPWCRTFSRSLGSGQRGWRLSPLAPVRPHRDARAPAIRSPLSRSLSIPAQSVSQFLQMAPHSGKAIQSPASRCWQRPTILRLRTIWRHFSTPCRRIVFLRLNFCQRAPVQ